MDGAEIHMLSEKSLYTPSLEQIEAEQRFKDLVASHEAERKFISGLGKKGLELYVKHKVGIL